MSNESRRLAGILLIVLPTVMFGGASLLALLIGDPKYMDNPLRQDLWRAGHAHAGVWLILALVALRYVDEANLSNAIKWIVRGSIHLRYPFVAWIGNNMQQFREHLYARPARQCRTRQGELGSN